MRKLKILFLAAVMIVAHTALINAEPGFDVNVMWADEEDAIQKVEQRYDVPEYDLADAEFVIPSFYTVEQTGKKWLIGRMDSEFLAFTQNLGYSFDRNNDGYMDMLVIRFFRPQGLYITGGHDGFGTNPEYEEVWLYTDDDFDCVMDRKFVDIVGPDWVYGADGQYDIVLYLDQ